MSVIQLYRMHDSPTAPNRAAIPVADAAEARRWNTPEQGYGIFMTVNSFASGVRRKDSLRRINAWAIDMDEGDKASMRARLLSSPLVPSWIIETKRGYQAWWHASDGAVADHWNALVLERLVPWYGADKNARDLCRILRVPTYLHLKDSSSPFRVELVWEKDVVYTERQLALSYPWVPDKASQRSTHDEGRRQAAADIRERAKTDAIAAGLTPTESLWDAIYALDCEEGLARLSGHAAVGGEKYTFRRTARGRLNVFVDGKGTPCFIDENKRIGSPSGGGPTLVQWLRWFRHDWPTVINTIKELFPRLAEIDDAARKARRAA